MEVEIQHVGYVLLVARILSCLCLGQIELNFSGR